MTCMLVDLSRYPLKKNEHSNDKFPELKNIF